MRTSTRTASDLLQEAFVPPFASLLLLFLVCTVPLPAQAWEDKNDNKAPAALERLADWEVCQEVAQVCQRAAPPESEVGMEALEYLSTVRQVVEQRHGGTLPAWLVEASSAIAAHEPQRCPSAACVGLREVQPE